MDKQRCRFLLRACRPNGADAADPTFREALEQTRLDPELGAWFAREQAIDRAVAARLRDMRAPPELRRQILDGLAVSARRPARRPIATAIAGLAAAASVAIAIYTAWPSRPAGTPFETIVASAVAEAQHTTDLGHYSDSAADIRTWLVGEGAPIPGELPRRLAALTTIGARTVKCSGVRTSLVAFRAPAFYTDEHGVPVDSVVHLFTIDQRSCSEGSATRQPIVFTKDGQTVATWRDARHYYVLTVRAPEDAVRALLAGTGAPALARRDAMTAGQPRPPSTG